MRIQVVQGDITRLALDAIVNAANPTLLGGGGVDGAIHRAAGPGLLAECQRLPELVRGVRCPTGEARLTGGHALSARFVIHTVGPVWHGGDAGEAALLAACYRNTLRLAQRHALASVAFPAISCGVYGYPPEEAVPLAVANVRDALAADGRVEHIVFCCFDAATARRYESMLGAS